MVRQIRQQLAADTTTELLRHSSILRNNNGRQNLADTRRMASLPTHGHCNLFELPQELQDTIFTLAYPAVSGLKLIFQDEWEEEQ